MPLFRYLAIKVARAEDRERADDLDYTSLAIASAVTNEGYRAMRKRMKELRSG